MLHATFLWALSMDGRQHMRGGVKTARAPGPADLPVCVAPVQVAKRELKLECDYRHELQSQQRFKQLIEADPYTSQHFYVPAVVPELSTERMLVRRCACACNCAAATLCCTDG